MATVEQIKRAAKRLARDMFPLGGGATADLHWDDLIAAIGSVDTMMAADAGTLNAAQAVKVNFVQNFPDPFKSNTNAAQKALALIWWAYAEAGKAPEQ